MSQDKDYSLLRPFDLEKAKAGETLTGYSDVLSGNPAWEYVAGPDPAGDLIVKRIDNGKFASPASANFFRMAPLCWVEGKPVYKGDGPLYFKNNGGDTKKHYVDLVDGDATKQTSDREDSTTGWVNISSLTWTPPDKPKVKKEGWAVAQVKKGVFENKADAEALLAARKDTLDILSQVFEGELRVIRIEWEEPSEVGK